MGGSHSKWDYEQRTINELKQARNELAEIYKFERDPAVKKEFANQIKLINDQLLAKKEGTGIGEDETHDECGHGIAHNEAKKILHSGFIKASMESSPEEMQELENTHRIMDHIVDKILIPN
jgi:hypothetical protein